MKYIYIYEIYICILLIYCLPSLCEKMQTFYSFKFTPESTLDLVHNQQIYFISSGQESFTSVKCQRNVLCSRKERKVNSSVSVIRSYTYLAITKKLHPLRTKEEEINYLHWAKTWCLLLHRVIYMYYPFETLQQPVRELLS